MYVDMLIVILTFSNTEVLIRKYTELPYIANCSRWKSFMVAELNFNLLENFHGWTVVLHGQGLLHKLFHWKSLWYRSIHENHETFPPRMICNIQYTVVPRLSGP